MACPACASAGSSSTPEVAEALWAYHDYTTIAPGALSDRLAQIALAPEHAQPAARAHPPGHPREPAARSKRGWRGTAIASRGSAPEAGAIVYTRYAHPINSTALVTRLRDEESVLVVPGDQFGMDGYLRLGVGERAGYLMAGLERVRALLDRLPQRPAPRPGDDVATGAARCSSSAWATSAAGCCELLDEARERLPFTWTLAGVCSRSRGSLVDPAGLDHRACLAAAAARAPGPAPATATA